MANDPLFKTSRPGPASFTNLPDSAEPVTAESLRRSYQDYLRRRAHPPQPDPPVIVPPWLYDMACAEGWCPEREDHYHCKCWWDDGQSCCDCGQEPCPSS